MAVRSREMENRVAEALARRIRHPALERTLFRRDLAVAGGVLEQVEALVRFAAAEWRLARRRLAEHTAELRSLRETVAALAARVDGSRSGRSSCRRAGRPRPAALAPVRVCVRRTRGRAAGGGRDRRARGDDVPRARPRPAVAVPAGRAPVRPRPAGLVEPPAGASPRGGSGLFVRSHRPGPALWPGHWPGFALPRRLGVARAAAARDRRLPERLPAGAVGEGRPAERLRVLPDAGLRPVADADREHGLQPRLLRCRRPRSAARTAPA